MLFTFSVTLEKRHTEHVFWEFPKSSQPPPCVSLLATIHSQWDTHMMSFTWPQRSVHSSFLNSTFIVFPISLILPRAPEILMLTQNLIAATIFQFHPTLRSLYNLIQHCIFPLLWIVHRNVYIMNSIWANSCTCTVHLLAPPVLRGYKLQPQRCSNWKPGPVPGKLEPLPGSATL